MFDARALTGMTIMGAVAISAAVDATIVRLLAGDVHPFMMAFTRVTFGVVGILPLIISRPSVLRSQARFAHILRAALKLGSLVALFAALQSAPIATVTAITFAAPLFVTLGAWLFLSERPGKIRIAGLFTGFAGILVILAPAMGLGTGQAFMLALLSAFLTSAIQLMLKTMGRVDSADTLVVWNLIISIPLALIPALLFWSTPTLAQWALLAFQGILGAYTQFGVTRALQLADASLVAPIDFLKLPFVTIAGWVFFSQIPRIESWIGAALILLSILFLAASSRLRGASEGASLSDKGL
ncbi:DMT family transporter [Paracoccaceae bacterium GXU_MW_L88]